METNISGLEEIIKYSQIKGLAEQVWGRIFLNRKMPKRIKVISYEKMIQATLGDFYYPKNEFVTGGFFS